ncbi:hypothetical protein VXS05_05190 [Photobacterium toruni]|uniref:hypothetical protein n=1 Tax=Photobacterium toruni TaxID=1935446 RepID=UPI002E194BA0|nr:hypothetical protein [Photobacterium toruni]
MISNIKQKQPHIYILDGVEDYLTNGAKTHKRNLMYAVFLCITLAIFGINHSYSSIFGFRLENESNISNNIILSLVMVVCFYESVMLLFYMKHCNSQWFGKSFNYNENIKNDNEYSESQMEKFKGEVKNQIYFDKNIITILDTDIDSSLKRAENEYNILMKIISTYYENIKSEYDDNKSYKLPNLDTLTSAVENRLNALKYGDGISERTSSECLLKEIKKLYNFPNETTKNLSEALFSFEGLLKSDIDKIKKTNDVWKYEIKEKINTIEKVNTSILKILNDVKRAPFQFKLLEIYIPILFSVIALFLGSQSIFNPDYITSKKDIISNFIVKHTATNIRKMDTITYKDINRDLPLSVSEKI